MSELKPCPFCGGEAQLLKDHDRVCVGCDNDCCLGFVGLGWLYLTEAEAVEAWNTRFERTCRNLAEPDVMNENPFYCSECGARGPYGEAIYAIEDGSVSFWDGWPTWKYCPNCGAKVMVE